MEKSNVNKIPSPDMSEKTKEKPECCTETHKITVIGFLILFMQYAMRVNMSVAIVPMTEEFHWDEHTQGMVLGVFFYGYILTNIVGGIAAEAFGGRIVLAVSLLVTGALTVATPVTSRWSVTMLYVIRFVEGLAEGVAFPAMTCFLTKWVPVQEKCGAVTRIFTGYPFGTFVTLFAGGWLSSSSLGWPSLFYVTGVLGVLLGAATILLFIDDPRDKKGISEKELKHIVEQCRLKEQEGKVPTPWLSIMSCRHVWYVSSAAVGDGCAFYLLLTEVPTYLVRMGGFSINYAGVVSGAMYLLTWISGQLFGTFITSLISKKTISVTFCRRVSQGITSYGLSLGFICLILTDSPGAAVAILLFAGVISGARYSSLPICPSDISTRFAGTIMGIVNTIGNFSGFAIPAIVGAITYENQTQKAWNYVFLFGTLVNIILSTPYILFFKSELQPWNDITEPKSSVSAESGVPGKEKKEGSEIAGIENKIVTIEETKL